MIEQFQQDAGAQLCQLNVIHLQARVIINEQLNNTKYSPLNGGQSKRICKGNKKVLTTMAGGSGVTSWLVHSTPDQQVQVQALAREIVLCFWARHFILTLPHSTQVYKLVLVNLMLGETLQWSSTPSRGEQKYSLLTSCYRNQPEISFGLLGFLAS